MAFQLLGREQYGEPVMVMGETGLAPEDFYMTLGRPENRVALNAVMSFDNSRLHLRAEPHIPKSAFEELAREHGAEITSFLRIDSDTTGHSITFTFDRTFTYHELQERASYFESLEMVRWANVGRYTTHSPRGRSGTVPTDPQWNYNWGLEAVFAPEAWEYRDRMSQVRVLVLDTSFYKNHEDLNFLIGPSPQARLAVPYHGTHVAGIIGATWDNNRGVAGIAPNVYMYGVQLMTYTADGEWVNTLNDSEWMDLVDFYVRYRGVQVINYSMGWDLLEFATASGNENARRRTDELTEYLERRLLALVTDGHEFVFVPAAGNQFGADSSIRYSRCNNYCDQARDYCVGFREADDGPYAGIHDAIFSPFGNMQNREVTSRVIIVGATQQNGEWAPFSQRGWSVDVSAPGVAIYSTHSVRADNPTTRIANALGVDRYIYRELQGTSMSAPFVSGLAAMIFGINPNFCGSEVKEIIVETAVLANNGIDAGAAVRAAVAEVERRQTPLDDRYRDLLDELQALHYQRAREAYYEFMRQRGFESWVEWAWQGEQAARYAILDIDGDGIPELIISTPPGDLHMAFVFYYDLEFGVTFTFLFPHIDAQLLYSQRYGAIVATELEGTGVRGIQYYTMDSSIGGSANPYFTLTYYPHTGTYRVRYECGRERTISYGDFRWHMDELVLVEFRPIPGGDIAPPEPEPEPEQAVGVLSDDWRDWFYISFGEWFGNPPPSGLYGMWYMGGSVFPHPTCDDSDLLFLGHVLAGDIRQPTDYPTGIFTTVSRVLGRPSISVAELRAM